VVFYFEIFFSDIFGDILRKKRFVFDIKRRIVLADLAHNM